MSNYKYASPNHQKKKKTYFNSTHTSNFNNSLSIFSFLTGLKHADVRPTKLIKKII